MRSKTVCIFLVFVMAVTSFSQDLTKEEKAVKKSLLNAIQAWYNKDYDEWQKWIYQDESYYTLAASVNGYSESRGWKPRESNPFLQSWFEGGPRTFKAPEIKNLTIKAGRDLAFTTFTERNAEHARLFIKDEGIWKEMYVGFVSTWGYERNNRKTNLEKFTGNWELDAETVTIDPPFSFEFVSGHAAITLMGGQLTFNPFYYISDSNGDWTYHESTNVVLSADNESIHVMRYAGNSGGQTWAFTGTAELSDDALTSETYENGNKEARRFFHTLTLKDADHMLETLEWIDNGEKTRTFSWEWRRK